MALDEASLLERVLQHLQQDAATPWDKDARLLVVLRMREDSEPEAVLVAVQTAMKAAFKMKVVYTAVAVLLGDRGKSAL